MSQFLRPALSALDPYVPGEQPQDKSYIKLNTNENPYPPAPSVMDAITREAVSQLKLYSDPTIAPLKAAIAQQYGLQPENVFVTNGSDETLGFSFLAYADAEHPVTIPDISYGFYKVFAQLFQVVRRNHAQTGMGALQGGGGLAHEAGMVQAEPVEGVAVGVGAVMYGFVAGAEGSQSLHERGVALQNLLHVQSS